MMAVRAITGLKGTAEITWRITDRPSQAWSSNVPARPAVVLGGLAYTWATNGPEDLDRVFGLVDADGNRATRHCLRSQPPTSTTLRPAKLPADQSRPACFGSKIASSSGDDG
jgi:hypothetical protein